MHKISFYICQCKSHKNILKMDINRIIDKFYPLDNELKKIYMVHARKVAELALDMASRHSELNIDKAFVHEAAMLHDIGIFLTDAPRIHCFGDAPYICHGHLGAELLRGEGLPRHAMVCERHTGTGLTKEVIVANGWPLPHVDMRPVTLEEQLICFADKFYSKTKYLHEPRSFLQVVESMRKISDEAVDKILEWERVFG